MKFPLYVFFRERTLIFTTPEKSVRLPSEARDYASVKGTTQAQFTEVLNLLTGASREGVIWEGESEEEWETQIGLFFQQINAGGGVVTNEDERLLMIFRNEKWDLPKGKQDPGESISDCALREVREETGLASLSLGAWICDSYHMYEERQIYFLKKTSWFRMYAGRGQSLIPQTEEGISRIAWVNHKQATAYLEQSYQTIRKVIREAALF